jgi:hypothetical protein
VAIQHPERRHGRARHRGPRSRNIYIFFVGIPVLAVWLCAFASSNYAGLGLAGFYVSLVLLGFKGLSNPDLRPMGYTILTGFFGGVCFFAIDAGLKLLMG